MLNIEAKSPRWKELYQSAITAIVSEIGLIIGIIAFPIYHFAPGNKSTESIFSTDWYDFIIALIARVYDLVFFTGPQVS